MNKVSEQKKSILFVGLLILFSDPYCLHAQSTIKTQNEDMKRQSLTANPPVSEPPLDLKSAVEKAVANNNQIKTARAKVEQDKNDKLFTRGVILPVVNFVGAATETKAVVQQNPNSVNFNGEPYNQYNAGLTLAQPLFQWGALSAIRVADYTTKLNELDIEIAVRSLTQSVISTFYNVLLQQKLLQILERTQAVVNESLATSQQRLRTGRGQLLDVLQVKTNLALLIPQIEQAHNALETAGAQLATLLAEEGKYELQLRGSLNGLLLKDVQRKMDFKNARLPELEHVRALREQLAQTKEVLDGKYLPNVTLNGNYGYQSYTKGSLFNDYGLGWSFGLTLTVPLFDGFQSIFQRRSIVEQDRQLDFQGRDLENTLALNQVQSLKSLQSTGASLISAEQAADLADQSLAEARKMYRLATIDFLQFLTVEQSTLTAYQSLDQIKYNNIVAFAAYFVATGQPLSILIDVLEEKNK